METYVQVLCQILRLLCLVIQRRRSRFDDYIGHLGQTISRRKRVLNEINLFLIQCANDFLLWIWLAVNAWTRIFLYVFKDKSSCITRITVISEQPSSFAIFRADFRFLFKHTFRLILAINCFVLTDLGRPGGDLAKILSRVMWAYYLYTEVFGTVLLSFL